MALADHDDFPISISVEAPFEDDPYGLSQTFPADDNDFLNDTTSHFKEDLLSSLYSLDSPLLGGYPPSSPDSPYSFVSSHDSPLYSPQSLSIIASPSSTAFEDLDFPHQTVSPQDITPGTIDSSFWGPSAVEEQPEGRMEPLFEPSFSEDSQSQDLVAIDGLDSALPTSSTLFSSQKAIDLRVTIPSVPSSRPTSPFNPCSPAPGLSVPSLSRERSLSPAVSDASSEGSEYASPLSQSLSPLPGHESTRSRRRSSTASDSSLRVRSSPNRGSPRQHPYARPAVDTTYAAAAAAASMTLEGYMLIIEALQEKEAFKGRDWSNGLPDLVKPIVGSAQTRRASEERRTDKAAFNCPVKGCGSSVTKKHNLMYHLQSHFGLESSYRCPICKRGISHAASLKRHLKGHDSGAAGTKGQTSSPANGNRKKRGRRN